VSVRERDGNSVPADFNSESQVAAFVRAFAREGMVVRAGEALSRDREHERFEVKRIVDQEAHGLDGACADLVENHFDRLRAKAGIHHVAGSDFFCYAQGS